MLNLVEIRKFVTDVGHRWNSTYLLLKSFDGYEALINEFYNFIHTRNESNFILTNTDSKLTFKVKRFLKFFYDFTNILSRTSAKFLNDIYSLQEISTNMEMFMILPNYYFLWNQNLEIIGKTYLCYFS